MSSTNNIPSQKLPVIGSYTLGKELGEGTFGKVIEGRHIPTNQKVAIKILEKGKV